MSPERGYKPFLIGEGRQKTGLFTYLESWIKPDTAYDTLENAYVYRGSLYSRNGFTLFPSAPAAGALLYQNNEVQVSVGDGTTGPFNGTLAKFPLIATATITANTALGIRSSTATFAAGNVNWSTTAGDLAASGTINFSTGVWTITTSSAIVLNAPIVIQYTFIPTGLTTPVNNPIMGIKQFINETLDTNILVVMDTRRLSYWDSASNQFQPVSQLVQNFYMFPDPNDGSVVSDTSTGNIDLGFLNIAPYSVSVTDGTNTMVDDGSGNFVNTVGAAFNVAGGQSSITYATGIIKAVYNAPPAAQTLLTVTATVQGDYFSGDNTNFFHSTNWDQPDLPSFLYLTNNVDPITLFNGTTLSRPAFALYRNSVTLLQPSQVLFAFRNDIAKALDVQVFQDRLLVIRPTIYQDDVSHTLKTYAENQSIYSSCPEGNLSFFPTNFVLPTEIAGNGAVTTASTGDILQAEELIRDVLIVFFTNSTWIMRSGNSPSEPFRFYRLNVSRTTNAPYGSVAYDITASSMGARGLIMSDGVGVDRYDESVIDLFEDINNNAFGQCFAQRYDAENQTWMLYPQDQTDSMTSDAIFVYNFLEDTWAIYKPNLGNLITTPTSPNTLSCLGLGFTTKDYTWDDFAPGGKFGPNGLTWDEANFPWNAFLEQDLTPSLLAGDQNGFVFVADDGPYDQIGPQGSTPNPIPVKVITHRLNPFFPTGQKASFGAVDIYYQKNDGGQIKLNIYGNNSNAVYKSFDFTLDGKSSEDFGWKRFYLNITAEFIRIEFNSLLGYDQDNVPIYNPAPPFKILGMILWATEGGRLTPGTFL